MGDSLTASPSSRTATVATRVGYMIDHGGLGFGPVGELSYAHTEIDPYREDGDALLTIGVKRQHFQRLTLGAGLQMRATKPIIGGLVQPYIGITAQRDLLDEDRTVRSYQAYTPTLLIRTDAAGIGDDWHGRVAGGANIGLERRVTATITGSTTFAERGGEDHSASVGLRVGF